VPPGNAAPGVAVPASQVAPRAQRALVDRVRRVPVRRARRRDDVPSVPRRQLPEPDRGLVRRVPGALARAGARQRVQCACVRVRGGAHALGDRVRAVRARELQGRARQRLVYPVPGQHQHDRARRRGAGGVSLRAGLLFGCVCVRALRRGVVQGPRWQRGVRAVPRRHVLPSAVDRARAVRGQQLAVDGGRTDCARLSVPAGI